MAEIKNSFLKSKMNKDLDDRLIPNGEYRDAQNISVGKSEDDDIGALETVLGNTLIGISDLSNPNLEIIGYITDKNNDSVYVFATDYTDGANFDSAPVRATSINRCIIYSWTPQNPGNLSILVDDHFLNFSTTNPIQATLIEELLFFTDNRNPPRKISIDKGVDYYTSETQISVAKYNPYQPISLVKKATGIVAAAPAPTSTTLFLEPITTGITNAAITAASQVTLTTSNPSIQEGMIISGTGIIGLCSVVGINDDEDIITLNAVQTIGITITLSFHAAVELDMAVVSTNKTGDLRILGDDYITVSAINNGVITLSQAPVDVANNPTAEDIFIFLLSTMTNKSGESTWPGDPDYLEAKFVRFSYRFRFDDGEYSIMAPFTQIAYIPKQKGYYLNGDEDAAYRSTILTWMENNVDNVELLIPLPDKANALGSSYKITDLDVLYKESDALIVKVLETLPLTDIISTSNENICSYSYQSRKPYKTLTQAQTVRVYDKVPVRSLAQETAGNRIIYGNFYDIYTPPSTVDYTVRSLVKTTVSADNWIEYPNHSLKQNRNYQVGFILCDKYGRQSSVILSPVSITTSGGALGSTFYSPYHTAADNITVRDWFGDALQVVVNNPINSNSGGGSEPNFTTGEPGLYAIRTGTGLGWSVDATTATTITNNIYTFALTGTSNTVVPVAGDFLRGEYTDYVEVISNVLALGVYTVTTGLNGIASTAAVVNSSYMNNYQNTPDIKWAYSINSTGWYSYKVVVKQTEQDYYNVYLPGILKGYPDQTGATASPVIPFPGISTDPEGSTSNIVLINDNINKVPRDLSEVGPDQKQFRSSVQLFGRVENTMTASVASNIQFYPGTDTDTAISIATTEDSNMAFANLSAEGQANIYQIDSKPLIARLATSTGVGVVSTTVTATNMTPYLAIYETEPVDSLLDIYWETTTVGMLSDLNEDVSTGYEGATSFSFDFSTFQESNVPGTAITDLVWPMSNEGAAFDTSDPTTSTAFSVVDGNGFDATELFYLYQDPVTKKYQIKTGAVSNGRSADAYFTYENDSSTADIYTFSITVKVTSSLLTNTITVQGALLNEDPVFSPALALITKTVDETAIGTLTAFNGTNTSNTTPEKIKQLQWTITAGNPTGVDLQPAFAIGASDGVLTQTINNTPNGLYSLTITLEDSVLGGVQGTGGETITGIQQVRIGPTPVNSGVKSTCIATIADATAMFPTNGTIAPHDDSSTLTAVWFLSDTVTAGAARTIYLQGTGWPAGITPSGTNGVFTGTGGGSGTVSCNTIHKLGGELTQGTVVFSLNMQLNYNSGDAPLTGIQGNVASWRVYHRIDDTQAWVIIPDINNHTMPATGIERSGGNVLQLQTFAVTDSYYLQYVLAYDTVGEYLIVAVETRSYTANQQSQALLTYVNSNDLNYSTCVIENGVNTTSGTATTYEYGISGSTGSYGCSFGLTSIYSNIAYGQYINQFFTTSSLTTAYPFVTDATDGSGTTHTNFYSYKMKVGPYREATADYKYSFSTRFTTGAGSLAKVYNPPSWGTACYIQNCGNTAVAATSCNPQALTYPYSIDTTTVG